MIGNEKSNFEKVDRFLQQVIVDKQIPGAVYGIVSKDKVLAKNALGYSHLKQKIPMTIDTIFDLASLTKVCATLPSILLLLEEGSIELEDPVKRFFFDESCENLTIRHLLTHTSGLEPFVPFYKMVKNKQDILKYILSYPKNPDKKVVYSDLNFILLGFIIEKVTSQTLDSFVEKNVFTPLGMNHTCYNPKFEKRNIAPTEYNNEKGDFHWGEVHDENAYFMDGVAGHAGVFSNLHDLTKFVRMILQKGNIKKNKHFLSSAIIELSYKNFTIHFNSNRGLGWQLFDGINSPVSQLFSKNSFGHTGFTGTSIWVEPEKELGFILLTNRVHISRKINMNRIRKIFHNLAFSIIY